MCLVSALTDLLSECSGPGLHTSPHGPPPPVFRTTPPPPPPANPVPEPLGFLVLRFGKHSGTYSEHPRHVLLSSRLERCLKSQARNKKWLCSRQFSVTCTQTGHLVRAPCRDPTHPCFMLRPQVGRGLRPEVARGWQSAPPQGGCATWSRFFSRDKAVGAGAEERNSSQRLL